MFNSVDKSQCLSCFSEHKSCSVFLLLFVSPWFLLLFLKSCHKKIEQYIKIHKCCASKTLSPLETSCSQHHDYYMQPCLSPQGIQSGIKLTILNYYCNKVWIRIGKQPVKQPFRPQLLLIDLSYCENSCRCAITCMEMLTTWAN